MKTPKEYEERNIKTLLEFGRIDKPFGISHIQRVCRIGYNQACHTVDRAINQGILVRDTNKESLLKFK